MSEIVFKPKLLYRRRISNTLENIFNTPLILIVAAVGYGKTSSVRRFLNNKKDVKQIWLSLGKNEIDDVWIWHKLCQSMSKLNPNLAQIFLKYSLPKNNTDITNIINILSKSVDSQTVLVIDDFNNIKSKYFNNLIEAFAYSNIKNIHIVIISRDFPLFAYKKLFKIGYCFIIKQDEIAFNVSEINDFFEQNGFKLSQSEQNMLFNYTDGWVSAVYLAMLSYSQEHNFDNIGNRNHLIKTIVYDKLNDNIKDALMRLSPLDSFTSSQALFITQNKVAITNINKLTTNNSFVKYDSKTKLYKINTLLKDVIFEALEESNIDISQIFNTCGDWYLQENQVIEAIIYYDKAKNYEQILGTIENYSNEIIYIAPDIILNIFKSIPKNQMFKYPLAYLIFIQFYLIHIDFKDGAVKLYEIKKIFEQDKKIRNENQILGEIAILEAIVNFNDIDKLITHLEMAYNILNGAVSKISYNEIMFTFGIPHTIYLYHQKLGELESTITKLENNSFHYNKIVTLEKLGYDYLIKSEYSYETGDFITSELLAHKAMFKSKAKNQLNLVISATYTLMCITILEGKSDDLEDYINELTDLVKKENNLVLINDADLAIGIIYSFIRQIDKIPEWIYNYDLLRCNMLVSNIGYITAVYGKIICIKKSFIELEILAEDMLEDNKSHNYMFRYIIANIYDAIAKYNLYGIERAKHPLLRAIEIAKIDNIIMPFAENAIDILPIFYEMENDYIKQILPVCEKFKNGINKINASQAEANLTQREIEVLNLVGYGYKNDDIGKSLGIASVTVEKILSNIYKKLDVKNRVAAVSKLKNL